MALTYPLVLKNSAAADVTFASVGSSMDPKKETSETLSVDAASTPAAPRNLRVAHTVKGSGNARVRSTLIQLTKDVVNPTTGFRSKLTTNLTWVMPLNGDVTNTDLYDHLTMIADLVLSTGALAVDTTRAVALLQGQS